MFESYEMVIKPCFHVFKVKQLDNRVPGEMILMLRKVDLASFITDIDS